MRTGVLSGLIFLFLAAQAVAQDSAKPHVPSMSASVPTRESREQVVAALSLPSDSGSAPEPRRSSHLARAEPAVFSSAVFLATVLLLGLTLGLMRQKPAGQSGTMRRLPFPDPDDLDLVPDDEPRLKTGTFLAEIRERELELEEGAEKVSRPRLIQIDVDSVRVIDEGSE